MRLLPALFAAAALLAAPGCVQYHLGSSLPADVRTVQVPICENKTSEPLIENDVTSAILSQIQMDGTLRVARDDADSVLEITLKDFRLDPVAYDSRDSATVNQYRMRITASFVLRRTSDSIVVAESPSVTGWYDFDFTGDMTSSKNVALTPASEDLGRRIVSAIVQYW